MGFVEKSYVRNESKKRYCPTLVIVTMPLFIIGMVLGAVVVIVNTIQFVQGSTEIYYWAFILFGICALWGIIAEFIYEYKMFCTISFKPGYFVYQYKLNSSVVASNNATTSYQITELSKIKVSNKYIKIWGKIQRRAPFKKPTDLKKVVLPFDNFDKSDEILAEINKFKKIGE